MLKLGRESAGVGVCRHDLRHVSVPGAYEPVALLIQGIPAAPNVATVSGALVDCAIRLPSNPVHSTVEPIINDSGAQGPRSSDTP